jgi:AraC-like DNA-binding protein
LRETTGLSLDLADLVGPEADELLERCAAARSVMGRFRVVAQWIGERFVRTHGMDTAVAWAVAQLDASGGAIPIAELRERMGLSKARLVEAFRDQVGLAPKLYRRIVRFRRTLGRLQNAGAVRLTDLALDAQYYDQPHMNAEFRALTGLAPRELIGTRNVSGFTISE